MTITESHFGSIFCSFRQCSEKIFIPNLSLLLAVDNSNFSCCMHSKNTNRNAAHAEFHSGKQIWLKETDVYTQQYNYCASEPHNRLRESPNTLKGTEKNSPRLQSACINKAHCLFSHENFFFLDIIRLTHLKIVPLYICRRRR